MDSSSPLDVNVVSTEPKVTIDLGHFDALRKDSTTLSEIKKLCQSLEFKRSEVYREPMSKGYYGGDWFVTNTEIELQEFFAEFKRLLDK